MKEVVDRTSSIEKCSLPQPASMAQLVERSAVNRQVLGSIPSGGVFFIILLLLLLLFILVVCSFTPTQRVILLIVTLIVTIPHRLDSRNVL